ncbi:MAG: hypothetical protein JNL19_01115 [Burkholderiales bacterium]|nr:hypothetical protein [Burkholderiales bacterium]
MQQTTFSVLSLTERALAAFSATVFSVATVGAVVGLFATAQADDAFDVNAPIAMERVVITAPKAV